MFVLIVELIVLIWSLIYFIKEEESFGVSLLGTFLFSLVGLLGAILISLVVTAFGSCCANYEIVKTHQEEIVCLQDNMGINGYRYAYRGYIDEKLQYLYLTEEEGKGITSKQIPADRTYINYTDEKPRVITHEMQFSNPVLHFFSSGFEFYNEYSLYLPEGSIAVEGQYNIDLQ